MERSMSGKKTCRRKQQVLCYYCSKLGHKAFNCRVLKANVDKQLESMQHRLQAEEAAQMWAEQECVAMNESPIAAIDRYPVCMISDASPAKLEVAAVPSEKKRRKQGSRNQQRHRQRVLSTEAVDNAHNSFKDAAIDIHFEAGSIDELASNLAAHRVVAALDMDPAADDMTAKVINQSDNGCSMAVDSLNSANWAAGLLDDIVAIGTS
jgi:hypothetical protein